MEEKGRSKRQDAKSRAQAKRKSSIVNQRGVGGRPYPLEDNAPKWAIVAQKILLIGQGRSIEKIRNAMHKAAENLDFEEAARLRDLILQLEKKSI